MSAGTSNWIPLARIRIAAGLALACAACALAGSFWTPFALVLLAPAAGAGFASFVMLRIRGQLSDDGGGWQRRIHERVIARVAVAPGSTLLDIGCGDGSLLALLLSRVTALKATGIDFWGDDWDYAQSACERCLAGLGMAATFHRMDAARLEFPDQSFDAVVSVMCFHEVRVPSGAPLRGPLVAVTEALRVLKPGGCFVLVDRFADPGDYGPPDELLALLEDAQPLSWEPLAAELSIPWPLNASRALGPVVMVSGRKPGQARGDPSAMANRGSALAS